MVLLLYFASAILFVFRIAANGRMATLVRESLAAMQSEYLTIGAEASRLFIGAPLMLITLLGTLATAYFWPRLCENGHLDL